MRWSRSADKIVDSNDRRLRRIFNNGSFEEGRRLFGGFWQPLKKTERAEGLIIEDEAVASLDFGQMTPRILYGMAGVFPSVFVERAKASSSARSKSVEVIAVASGMLRIQP